MPLILLTKAGYIGCNPGVTAVTTPRPRALVLVSYGTARDIEHTTNRVRAAGMGTGAERETGAGGRARSHGRGLSIRDS